MPDEDILSRSIESAKQAIEERNARLIEERRAAEEAHKNYIASELAKAEEKLRLSEGIFGWGKDFVNSRQYGEIQSLKKLDRFGFMAGSDYERLWIYSGGWGHEERDSYGCWSRFYVTPSATFQYRAGYKWMGFTGPELSFGAPEELARL